MLTAEKREELIAEIAYRMKTAGDANLLRLHSAMEIESQPTLALRNWLLYLKRAKICGGKDGT